AGLLSGRVRGNPGAVVGRHGRGQPQRLLPQGRGRAQGQRRQGPRVEAIPRGDGVVGGCPGVLQEAVRAGEGHRLEVQAADGGGGRRSGSRPAARPAPTRRNAATTPTSSPAPPTTCPPTRPTSTATAPGGTPPRGRSWSAPVRWAPTSRTGSASTTCWGTSGS